MQPRPTAKQLCCGAHPAPEPYAQVLQFYAARAKELEAAVASVEASTGDALSSPLSGQVQVQTPVMHTHASPLA